MAGKPILKKEHFPTIRKMVLDDASFEDIAKELGVGSSTFYRWRVDNTDGLHDFINNTVRERILNKAEKALERLVDSDDEQVSAKVSQFLGETLGKQWYSKQDSTVINVVMPTPILDLGKLVSTIPEKALIDKGSTD